jgi:hypothetical protein
MLVHISGRRLQHPGARGALAPQVTFAVSPVTKRAPPAKDGEPMTKHRRGIKFLVWVGNGWPRQTHATSYSHQANSYILLCPRPPRVKSMIQATLNALPHIHENQKLITYQSSRPDGATERNSSINRLYSGTHTPYFIDFIPKQRGLYDYASITINHTPIPYQRRLKKHATLANNYLNYIYIRFNL